MTVTLPGFNREMVREVKRAPSSTAGRTVVESLLEPRPSPYVSSLSPDRFTETDWDWTTARRQAEHYYQTYYSLRGLA